MSGSPWNRHGEAPSRMGIGEREEQRTEPSRDTYADENITRTIMDAYGGDEASDDEGPQTSVLGEAFGGSRPSTMLRTPEAPSAPETMWSSQPPMPSTSPSLFAGGNTSPEIVYAEAFDTDETPTLPAGRWTSPSGKGPQYQTRDPLQSARPDPLSSTPPRRSSSLNDSSPSITSSGIIPLHYNTHGVSDPELDLIETYNLNHASRPTSVLPASGSIMEDVVNDYGPLSRASSIMSHTTGTQKRVPHSVGPDTPDNSTHTRRMPVYANRPSTDATEGASLTDLYSGMYDGQESPYYSHDPHRQYRKYAPGVGDMSEPDHSFVSLPDQSTDQFILPADYQSQVFLGDDLHQLHDGGREWDERKRKPQNHVSIRGCMNVSTIVLLLLSVLMLFLGYPVIRTVRDQQEHRRLVAAGMSESGSSLPMRNSSNIRTTLIDPDTPVEKHNRTRLRDGKPMVLVFSDEFKQEGRSFYPGEDPFWEAVDLHYWQTQNYEWWDPEAIKTQGGNLVITMSQKPEHNLNFRSGMMSTWNKFCFTGGYIEVGVQLPGRNNVSGLWPAAWTMGNLGRAGYGASTDGLWPYSYDTCDVGTLRNQTYLPSQGGGPIAAETTGHYIDNYGPQLSALPGQRLSRCTCPKADHPGPKHADGTWKARSAPEIDIFEAAANNGVGEHGQVSMSMQVAPFDAAYNITQENGGFFVHQGSGHEVRLNDYTGSTLQQAVSAKVNTTDDAYQLTGGGFDSYGFEYEPGGTNASYLTYTVSERPVVTFNTTAFGPNPQTEIGQRLIPEEPMYIIMNLGIASSFSFVNWWELEFPAVMRISYVRVWQEPDKIRTSCSPPDFPTKDYIERHKEAYTNSQLRTWTDSRENGGYGKAFPKNMLVDQC
ncbi:hypothetical protein MYAM1_002627 [Malassezia yamatoensis]|uniref:GH16 domain-containing protein n=1 Tax=Malassezia yamatoensis TaxID=253288 RepID=A0AAJ6CJH9_9BASI|nr:hypothetical protein MYAM1_002627 [Malassezia yamatoensis]